MEFSIRFDIDISKNPLWCDKASNILFPPFFCDNGVQVFFKKQGEILKIFIMRPEHVYKKLLVPLRERIGKNTTIVLIYSTQEIKVHFTVEPSPALLSEKVEDGDVVMLTVKQGEIRSVAFPPGMDMVVPAVYNPSDDAKIGKFFVAGTNESVVLPVDRIVL